MKKYIDAEAFFKVINILPYKDTSYPGGVACWEQFLKHRKEVNG